MNKIRTIVLTGLFSLGTLSLIAYSSCAKKDKCDSITCKNGGTCDDGVCKCPVGFEGANCETLSANKFKGSFSATDNCPVPDSNRTDLKYNVTITLDNTEPTTLYISNLANVSSQPTYALTATLTGKDEVTIESQTLPDNRTYSGTIQYVSDGRLSATFQIRANGQIVEACNTLMTK